MFLSNMKWKWNYYSIVITNYKPITGAKTGEIVDLALCDGKQLHMFFFGVPHDLSFAGKLLWTPSETILISVGYKINIDQIIKGQFKPRLCL